MNEITDAFIRSVKDRVETSSTVGQFRECLKMYDSVLYNSIVRSLFLERVFSLRSMHTDKLSQDILTTIVEEIEESAEILSVSNTFKSGLTFTLVFKAQEGSAFEAATTEIVCTCLRLAEGKKKEAARILGISVVTLTDLIDANADRRLFLQSLKKKLKSVDE